MAPTGGGMAVPKYFTDTDTSGIESARSMVNPPIDESIIASATRNRTTVLWNT